MLDILSLLFVLFLPSMIFCAIFAIPIVAADKRSKDMLKDYDPNSYPMAHME